jgi:cation transporter-like permease
MLPGIGSDQTKGNDWRQNMLAALLVLLLLILLFGGLGIFVAKVFFIALAIALLVSIVSGGLYLGRR